MSTTETQRRVAYIATIKREGDEWVAYTQDRIIVARIKCDKCKSATAAAQKMFAYGVFGGFVSPSSRHKCRVKIFEEQSLIPPVTIPSSKNSKSKASPTAASCSFVFEEQADSICTAIESLDHIRSKSCHSNPLLAYCLEHILVDLRKAADELAMLAKGGE